ncbi:hypothetical protein AX14_001132 [Amanita brunnescens Koide BX004]|nr:hypothetical protein AX14_001132 [Amanita brunnescens Koide BX004]
MCNACKARVRKVLALADISCCDHVLEWIRPSASLSWFATTCVLLHQLLHHPHFFLAALFGIHPDLPNPCLLNTFLFQSESSVQGYALKPWVQQRAAPAPKRYRQRRQTLSCARKRAFIGGGTPHMEVPTPRSPPFACLLYQSPAPPTALPAPWHQIRNHPPLRNHPPRDSIARST